MTDKEFIRIVKNSISMIQAAKAVSMPYTSFVRKAKKLECYRPCREKIKCQFCERLIIDYRVDKHELHCKYNPINLHLWSTCIICEKLFLNKYQKRVVCSKSCSNTYYRSYESNKSYTRKDKNINPRYRRIAFKVHKKECIICGEKIIVEIHHFNKNKEDNNPFNLIPLCPTHHKYCHSRHYHLIKDEIIKYRKQFKSNNRFES